MKVEVRIGLSIILVLAIITISTFGYILIEDLPLIDALYMTIITVSTVGFREVKPLSSVGKIWTILVILFGWASVSVLITNVASYFLSKSFIDLFARRRKMKRKFSGHYIICGFGRMGKIVAEFLKKSGVPFLIVENDPEKIQLAEGMGYTVVEGDATEEDTLKVAGVENAKGLVALLRNDPDNLYVIINAKNINPNIYTVAKATTEKGARLMEKVGANRVILPYDWAGLRIARALLHPAIFEFLDLYDMRVEEIKVNVGSPFEGKTLKELNLTRHKIYVLAILRDKKIITPPSADERILEGDILIVIGEVENLHKFEKLVQP